MLYRSPAIAMNIIQTDLAHLGAAAVQAFCALGARDASSKAARGLDGSRRVDLPHTQILELPARPRPPITLALHVWERATQAPDRGAALLGHGWGLQAGRMGAFVAPLRDAGFRVAALDLPGHGASGGSESNLADITAALAAASAALGGARAVIGHSFSGMAAVWALANGGLRDVEALVLVSSAANVAYLAESSAPFRALSAEAQRAFRDAFKARFGREPAAYDLAAEARRVPVPTLVVHDRRDAVVPFAHGEAYAAALPRGELFATDGYGHFAILRSDAVMRRADDFLRG